MERPTRVLYRTAAIVEAITWLGLLIGMLFKYVIDGNEIGVRIFGMAHGVAFIAYVPITLLAAARFRWGLGVSALGVLAAFPPFGTLVFDLWAERTGRLSVTPADRPSSLHGQRSSK